MTSPLNAEENRDVFYQFHFIQGDQLDNKFYP